MSQTLNKELEKLLEAYCEVAPENAKYPYKVFSAKKLSEADNKGTYVLEVNVWDQHPYYSRAESIMDKLEQKLHRCNHMTDKHFIYIYKGKRQPIPDPDKTIKRVMEQFEMYVYDKED